MLFLQVLPLNGVLVLIARFLASFFAAVAVGRRTVSCFSICAGVCFSQSSILRQFVF